MKNILFHLAVLIFPAFLHAQVDTIVKNVLVETYYISDANDALDTTAADTTVFGTLPEGSVTYRIYIHLASNCTLRKIYGDTYHALKFSSDSVFFNHYAEGKSFGNTLYRTRYQDYPTVALDTWLTLRNAARDRSGILKTEDPNTSSLLGGMNSGGFLNNNNAAAGIPLTQQDGLMDIAPNNNQVTLSGGGDLDFISYPDSTIFGSLVPGSQFISNDAFLQISGAGGAKGPTPENKILIAQLTTRGKISFELNIEVEVPEGGGSKLLKYVAKNDTLGEILSPYLAYPPSCGCRDPRYLEYNTSFACGDSSSCITLKRFGCTDPLACNFDSGANINLQAICCYPGFCSDRDLNYACPTLKTNGKQSPESFIVYPNPAQGKIEIEITDANGENRYELYDSFGVLVAEKKLGSVYGKVTEQVDLSGLPDGLYMLRVSEGSSSNTKLFIKN